MKELNENILRNENKFYVGGDNWLDTQIMNTKKKIEKIEIDKIKLYLKKYLLLDNVNFLFGTGSSIHLGAESIQGIPKQVEDFVNESNSADLFNKLKKTYENKIIEDIKKKISTNEEYLIWENRRNMLDEPLLSKLKDIPVINEKIDLQKALSLVDSSEKEKIYKMAIEIKLEEFLNYLYALKYLIINSAGLFLNENTFSENDVESLIQVIKKAIFKMCDLDKISIENNIFLQKKENENIKTIMLEEGKYTYHKSFLTSILQRPLNLRRANIFTLNYDLAFEYACDELGIQYINGFVGFNERNFRPEVYNYDFFYPGDVTEGKVKRIERVIKYYKLHGSLNWVYEKENKNNPYGLYEIPIDLVRIKMDNESKENEIGDIMIYPSSSKKEFTLNFPYSDLFRKFADRLQQPEAVLFVIGYSFCDEHINDIIYQALANPSFTLIIVDFKGTDNGGEILKLNKLKDPRIIISQGKYLGDFKFFSKELLPNMDQEDTRIKVTKTLEKLFSSPFIEEKEEENV